jgi:hypothetical protein
VCPACGNPTGGGNLARVDLGGPFIGLSCGHCGHLRLFDERVLDARHE